MKVGELILNNKNTGVRWLIDKIEYDILSIPEDTMQKTVFSWIVNQWEGIIEIKTTEN